MGHIPNMWLLLIHVIRANPRKLALTISLSSGLKWSQAFPMDPMRFPVSICQASVFRGSRSPWDTSQTCDFTHVFSHHAHDLPYISHLHLHLHKYLHTFTPTPTLSRGCLFITTRISKEKGCLIATSNVVWNLNWGTLYLLLRACGLDGSPQLSLWLRNRARPLCFVLRSFKTFLTSLWCLIGLQCGLQRFSLWNYVLKPMCNTFITYVGSSFFLRSPPYFE